MSAIRSALAAHGDSSDGTDAQLAAIGNDLCTVRQDGSSQATLIAATRHTEAKFDMTAAQFVKTAERDICPSEYPKPATILLRLSGSGIQNSAPFTVSSGTLTVHYSYDCSSFGSASKFVADLETGNQASLDSDDQSIANALGTEG